MSPSMEAVKESSETVVRLHNIIIDQTGGEKGVRDRGGLEHGIDRLLYHFDKDQKEPVRIATLVYEIFAKRHYFIGGIKELLTF